MQTQSLTDQQVSSTSQCRSHLLRRLLDERAQLAEWKNRIDAEIASFKPVCRLDWNQCLDCGTQDISQIVSDHAIIDVGAGISGISEMGKTMWDWIASTPYCQGSRIPVYDRKSVPVGKTINSNWNDILHCLNRVGKPSGEGEMLRPSGEFITDFAKDPHGWRLLEAAHSTAHVRTLRGENSDGKSMMLEAIAAISFCRIFGVEMHLPPLDNETEWDGFVPGVEFITSASMRKPWMYVDKDRVRPYKSVLFVLVGVHLEPHPWSAREDNPDKGDEHWLELNRWSCMPSMTCVSGFAFADELSKAPLVGKWPGSGPDDASFALPVSCLHGPSLVPLALEALGCGTGSPPGLINDEWLDTALRVTPPLPCRECLRLNMSAEGAPSRPAKRRPKDGSKDQEWEEYDRKVDKIFRVVEKACEFHDMRSDVGHGRKARKERARSAKKAAQLIETRNRLLDKAHKARSKMQLTMAQEMEAAAEDVSNRLASILKPTTTGENHD